MQPQYKIEGELESHAAVCACEVSDPARARLIYLNILAVRAVETYLHEVGLSSDRRNSSSYRSSARKMGNIADLAVRGLGTLECRPVLPDQHVAVLPYEELRPRVATVLVEINEPQKVVKILGFTSSRASKWLAHMREVDAFVPRILLTDVAALKHYLLMIERDRRTSTIAPAPQQQLAKSKRQPALIATQRVPG